MSVSANQIFRHAVGSRVAHPVAASTRLYEGTLYFVNSSGYAVGTTGSGANRFGGLLVKEADNSGGSAGDIWTEAEAGGIVELTGSGFSQASVGKEAFATDNFTVSAGPAANGVFIGIIEEYISSTRVRVRLILGTSSPVSSAQPGIRIATGQATTATASDTVATGLTTVLGVVATLNDVPAIGVTLVTADVGNQSGAPAAGSFLLKTWKPTATGDGTPIAATTFSKKVNWVAWGY